MTARPQKCMKALRRSVLMGERIRHFCDSSNQEWFDAALKSAENNQQQGISASRDLVYHLLGHCTKLQDLEMGRRVQFLMVQSGLEAIGALADHLIRLYAFCESLAEANQAFSIVLHRSQHTWNAILDAHVKLGRDVIALHIYDRMWHEGKNPNGYVFASALKACCNIGLVEMGRQIHEQILAIGFQSDIVIGGALIDMYTRCGSLDEARGIFDSLLDPNIVTWGAMIEGCAQHAEGLLALDYFEDMQHSGIIPDRAHFLSAMKACSIIGAVTQGRYIHEMIVNNGLQLDILVGSALVHMFASCGILNEARAVFNGLRSHNVVTWGAMVAGYADHGEAGLAVQCFEDMQCCNVRPNDVIFINMFIAFCRSGLVDEGLWYYTVMKHSHYIKPNVRHVTCMVDLLGHAGRFNELENLLGDGMQRDISLWTSLLNVCQMHGNVELGRRCFTALVQLDSHFAPAYVLMSNMYAGVHMLLD